MHVPFCDTLCWFCGCHTKITRKYEPVAAYLDALKREITTVAAAVPKTSRVRHIHWGGGSPTLLAPDDIRALADHLKASFSGDDAVEFAIEVDPRGLDQARITALAEAGLTRVSLGVQDFDPKVQERINRIQTFEETAAVIAAFRKAGVKSLNIDAIYGLPGQVNGSCWQAWPWCGPGAGSRRPVRLCACPVDEAAYADDRRQSAADLRARHAHATAAARFLVEHGYVQIGIDHFARPDDTMALADRNGTLRRNFQGYTTDTADALIGFGASAIGRLPQGHVQNVTAIAQYQRAVGAGALAIAKGLALTPEDARRAAVIEELMCTLAFDAARFRSDHGDAAQPILDIAESIVGEDRDGLVVASETGFR